jgi:hypothetical protein
LGELVYGLHAPESRRALQRRVVDCGGVVEPKKPWVSSGCFVLTLCVSGYVGLDWPPPGGSSGVFLAVKEVDSRTPSLWRPLGSFVFLCHAPCMTFQKSGWQCRAQGAAPGSPRASVARGLSSYTRALGGVIYRAGAKGRTGVSA